jgi:beta-galactosidase
MRKINLNDAWMFTKEALTKDNFQTVNWEKVVVPHTWNGIDGQNGGNNYYRGQCWYHKMVTVENTDERVYLEFEGVNSIATVVVNGEILGQHKGGYSTFRYDVTDYVTPGENLVIVGADNRHYEDVYPLMADFTFYGGIYRDVYLVYANKTSFDLTHVGTEGVYVSQKEITHDKAVFGVNAWVVNKDKSKDVTVKVELLDDLDNVILSKDVNSDVTDKKEFRLDLTLNNPHLWNGIEDPYLYNVQVTLLENGKELDKRTIPTGFRFYYFDDKSFYLNGKALRLSGVSRHQDRWEVGNALTKEMHLEDMALIKEVGANTIRLAHYQQAQYFYDLCDQEGMIIWAEIPYISISSKTDQTGTNAISQMEELVKQNYNHSSILLWGVQNEITIQGKRNNLESIVQNLHDLTKKWDPYRLTTQAHVAMHPLEDSMHDITDVIAYNNYFGWYMGDAEDFSPWLDEWRKLHPDKPIGLSEYGAEGIIKYHSDEPVMKDYTEEYHALWHEKVYTIFEQKEYIWGTYVWNMFAFAADARDEGGVKGLNNKGLVTIDRKVKKDAFFYYKAKWNNEPMLHLTSKRFVERHNKNIELKAYSNFDVVEFYLNGELVDTVHSKDVIFTTRVTLQDGENEVVVKSGTLSDKTVFKTVDKYNPEYVVPTAEQGKGIFNFEDAGNWFDDVKDDEEMTFNPDYFSINDVISDILANSEGLALFKKYMQTFLDHPMFEMAQGFTIKMITDFDKNAIPEGLVKIINSELQKIKK